MPWKEVRPMDQKVLFISDWLRGALSFTELCQRYGISRKTGYKWTKRYQSLGIDGLGEQARRPHDSPLKIPYRIRKAIVTLRTKQRITPGAKKIQVLLAQQFSDDLIPSQTTIYRILHSEGLVKKRKHRQRVAPFPQPFAPVDQSNQLWSVDFKGQFKVGSGQWCYPLTVMDHHCRYLLCCYGQSNVALDDTKEAFVRVFKEYGLPQRIRSDNGVPFASRAVGGLSRLSAWWVRLGICPERIEPGKPQQNGRHERMHRTLKQAVAQPPAHSMRSQQSRFNQFQKEYNEQRPHEALSQNTPDSLYRASNRAFPSKLPELTYPDHFEVKKVRQSGVLYWNNGQLYVSHILQGDWVGMEEVDDGVWDLYYGPVRLGGFDVRQCKVGAVPYWTLKM
ncbi:IS481 family transposase [Porticoccus sp. W117]|uniref:IS481 family transposase n=1 Tax=Porticoccus sp. W117 TaxID=3054777 RepID=UPI0025963ED9|nr:IS481 family transposase [Porticoccus sp. W117]MDM3872687.1 IS481 family transposase [Porticoccus sp. W117]